jgi:hypothetical protein
MNSLLPPLHTGRKRSEPITVPAQAPGEFAAEVRHYYSARKNDLMAEFAKFTEVVRVYLVTQHEGSKVDTWLVRSRSDYERLILELPYVVATRII